MAKIEFKPRKFKFGDRVRFALSLPNPKDALGFVVGTVGQGRDTCLAIVCDDLTCLEVIPARCYLISCHHDDICAPLHGYWRDKHEFGALLYEPEVDPFYRDHKFEGKLRRAWERGQSPLTLTPARGSGTTN